MTFIQQKYHLTHVTIPGLFLCAFCIARRQGNRFKDSCPQASGYELANQDEMTPAAGGFDGDDEDILVEEILEDEDDFEVSSGNLNEQNETGRGLMRLRSSSGEEDRPAQRAINLEIFRSQ